MKLIDKDALVAEIERMLHETVNNTDGSPYYGGRAGAFTSILSFINALEVQEVDFKKICEWLENHNDYLRIHDNGRGVRFDMTQCVFDLRKAMKENKL